MCGHRFSDTCQCRNGLMAQSRTHKVLRKHQFQIIWIIMLKVNESSQERNRVEKKESKPVTNAVIEMYTSVIFHALVSRCHTIVWINKPTQLHVILCSRNLSSNIRENIGCGWMAKWQFDSHFKWGVSLISRAVSSTFYYVCPHQPRPYSINLMSLKLSPKLIAMLMFHVVWLLNFGTVLISKFPKIRRSKEKIIYLEFI